ncbi:hypothetical protein KC19_4G043200 [Ceratodon purpureus]|uniref:Secreted protein n=1 Tax=Ceratodon purpureus TaxID=3225 RepID=A0A8T0I6G8_CERPU|nr:hypothetical protein KC19_4G043200 [Ceratodon purpureus]
MRSIKLWKSIPFLRLLVSSYTPLGINHAVVPTEHLAIGREGHLPKCMNYQLNVRLYVWLNEPRLQLNYPRTNCCSKPVQNRPCPYIYELRKNVSTPEVARPAFLARNSAAKVELISTILNNAGKND